MSARHARDLPELLEQDYLIDQGWVTAERVEVVAHGVPPEFFLKERPPRQARTLLFVAQWLPIKGPATFEMASSSSPIAIPISA